jgi:MFS transporter, DHA3 family, multidrug efflux protein
MEGNKKIFYQLLGNTLVASVTNAFVWFSLTFWVFIETHSVLATSFIAGIFALANMLSAFSFGSIVDHYKKHTAMLFSGAISLLAYSIGAVIFFITPYETFSNPASVMLWVLVVVLMIGSVAGNLRMIALSTTVTHLFKEGRDKANGMIGAVGGISFSITSILSGLVIGFYGMPVAIVGALIGTIVTLLHLLTIRLQDPVKEKKEESSAEVTPPAGLNIKTTIAIIAGVPGLFGLIFFTTFNNFLGGVFMALMDAYGLSLVSVQTWGIMFAFLSFGFILGSTYIAKYGLGSRPLRLMLMINIVTWTTCIFFTIQPSIILLAIGLLIWMTLVPFIEATEHTLIQSVVPYEKQGRVFGFAQSIESAATPITAFLIGPIAQLIFIPFMTTGAGVYLIGDWFGVGLDRGIALVFIIAGLIGLSVTLLAFRSKSYKMLSAKYGEKVVG